MNKLRLFAAFRRPGLNATPSRGLYTDPLYPYPFKYFNEKKFPTLHTYRENWILTPRLAREVRVGIWLHRLFWTYVWWNFLHDPGAVFGHHSFPDPSKWTDEELGIPPLDAGSYADFASSQE